MVFGLNVLEIDVVMLGLDVVDRLRLLSDGLTVDRSAMAARPPGDGHDDDRGRRGGQVSQ